MAYPHRREIHELLLREIEKRGGRVAPMEVYEPLAEAFELTPAERTAVYPRSKRLRWHMEVCWTRDNLVKSLDLDGSEHGVWKITAQGRARIGIRGQGQLLIAEQARVLELEGVFDAADEGDARERVVASIIRRRGQPDFRQRLIAAYTGRCAVSQCSALEALEAAHILPYNGPATNHITNGLLLRADLHTLFDLGLLAVLSEAMTVLVSPSLASTEYAKLAGKPLSLPKKAAWHPNRPALDRHRQLAGL